MPLSDHEQRMLDQIESALYAEDPKFASSVRGGTLRAPSARRRLQGALLFVVGLALLVVGVAVKATMTRWFPDLCRWWVSWRCSAVWCSPSPDRVSPAAVTVRRREPATRPRQRRQRGGSFTTRMEDRFRRRFDD